MYIQGFYFSGILKSDNPLNLTEYPRAFFQIKYAPKEQRVKWIKKILETADALTDLQPVPNKCRGILDWQVKPETYYRVGSSLHRMRDQQKPRNCIRPLTELLIMHCDSLLQGFDYPSGLKTRRK